jgi:iron complex transport system substrate-binding protein
MDESFGREPRVASLLPAATEIIGALGLERMLVGVSHECDWPSAVRGLPVLTRSKVATTGTSAEIHARVSSVALDALGVYDVDLEALARLAPDVIVTQDLCDVCAVPFAKVKEAVRALGLERTEIVSLKPQRLDDVWNDVHTVASALGRAADGERLVDSLTQRVRRIATRAARQMDRPRVLTIEWIDPVMIGGTWMPELVELAGGEPLVTRAGEHARTLSQKELAALAPAPEVVLIKPCGFELARSLMEIETINRLVTSLEWPACIRGEVFLADGNAYFNRPGPRLVESLEILAACVQPFEFRDFATKHPTSYTRIAARAGKHA